MSEDVAVENPFPRANTFTNHFHGGPAAFAILSGKIIA